MIDQVMEMIAIPVFIFTNLVLAILVVAVPTIYITSRGRAGVLSSLTANVVSKLPPKLLLPMRYCVRLNNALFINKWFLWTIALMFWAAVIVQSYFLTFNVI